MAHKHESILFLQKKKTESILLSVAFLYISNTEPGPARPIKTPLAYCLLPFIALHAVHRRFLRTLHRSGWRRDASKPKTLAATPWPPRSAPPSAAATPPLRRWPASCRTRPLDPAPRYEPSPPPPPRVAFRGDHPTKTPPQPPLKISCSQGGGAASTLHAATRGAPAPSIQAPSVVRRYCSAGVSSDLDLFAVSPSVSLLRCCLLADRNCTFSQGGYAAVRPARGASPLQVPSLVRRYGSTTVRFQGGHI